MHLPCLPLIQERFCQAIQPHVEEKTWYPDIKMYMFSQTWASTALGFGGIGGQAITSAYTTVVADTQYNYWGVFFGDRLAYLVLGPNDIFFGDLRAGRMASVAQHGKYIKKQ